MTPHKSLPRHAVALAYNAGDGAPKVSAKGYGPIADEIIRRAQDAGVYVHESRELVQLLMQVDLDAHIPPDLYRAIAVLLAWIYRAEQNLGIPNSPLPDLIGLIDK
jgi:flagellar biosynthesis protein